MKKITFSLLLLTITIHVFSQQIVQTPTLTKQDFILRSKHQKTAAWVLLTGGLALSSIGVIAATPKAAEDVGYGITLLPSILVGNNPEPPHNNYTTETILIIGGTAAMLSSIPLFAASGKNKRKAMSISFKNEMTSQIYQNNFVYKSLPSLALKFKL